MTWVLAYGSLICSLLVRSRPGDVSSPSRLWADDACRFFGFTSLLFGAVHCASVIMSSMFDIEPVGLLTLRDGQAWIETGLIVGTLSGWALVVANGLRFLETRLKAATTIRTVLMTLVLVGGAYHGWQIGSDVRNYVTYAVVAVAAVMALVAAGLAFGADEDRSATSSHDDNPLLEAEADQSPGNASSTGSNTPAATSTAAIAKKAGRERDPEAFERQGPPSSLPEWAMSASTEPEATATSDMPASGGLPRQLVELPELTLSRSIAGAEPGDGDDPSVEEAEPNNPEASNGSNPNGEPNEKTWEALPIPEIEGARLVTDHEPEDR